jgi:hypothetical protein
MKLCSRHFCTVLVLAALSLCPGYLRAEKAAATPLHFSLTEATTHRERGRLLLTVRVQSADLEAVLSEREGKAISVAKLEELAPAALDYVREKLIIKTSDGNPVRLEWAGLDVTDKQLFLFFEAPLTKGLLGARITNALFVDKIADQINSFEVLDGAVKRTLVFSRDKQELQVESHP